MQSSLINVNTNDHKKSQPMLSNHNNSEKVQSKNPSLQVIQENSALQKMKLYGQKSNKNNSQLNVIFATNCNQQQKKDASRLQQFAQAWKSQTNFSILLIEKLSLIASNYFKMLGDMTVRNQQIETLIIYNKGLIEVLTKFQDQQRKLIQKVNTLEQFNIKIMKQLCSLKKRPFEPPKVRRQQSIFQKFSLKKFKYERKANKYNKQNKQDEVYKDKIVNLFKGYLLQKNDHFIPIIQNKLKKIQQSNNPDKKMPLQTTNRVQQLKQLLQNVINYNSNLENVTYENMFDLYELKQQLKNQMKSQNLDIEQKDEGKKEQKDEGEKEKMFVENIKKIHANLSNLNQNQLQNYLKKQKQIRIKIKRQRIKQQQIFLQACQEAQRQNLQLKLDNKKLKYKIIKVQQQISKMKAENQFKWIKQRRLNKNYNEQNLNDSKKIKIDALLKKLREENQNLSQQNQQIKKQLAAFQQQKKIMIQRVKYNQVALEQNPSYETIINALIQNISYYKIKADLAKQFLRKEGILSKSEQDKQFQLAVSNRAIKEKKLKNQFQKVEMQIEQLKKRNDQLEKRLQHYKNIEDQLLKKGEKEKNQVYILQSQTNKNEIQFSTRSTQLNKKQNQITKKNARIRQIQIIQRQLDVLKQSNKQLQFLNQSAQKLARNIIKAVQNLTTEDLNYQKFLLLRDNLFENLQTYIKQYQQETKKQILVCNPYDVKLQENKQYIFTNKFKPQQNSKNKKMVDIGINMTLSEDQQINASTSKITKNQNKSNLSQLNFCCKIAQKKQQKNNDKQISNTGSYTHNMQKIQQKNEKISKTNPIQNLFSLLTENKQDPKDIQRRKGLQQIKRNKLSISTNILSYIFYPIVSTNSQKLRNTQNKNQFYVLLPQKKIERQDKYQQFKVAKKQKIQKPNSLLQIQPKPSKYKLKKQQQNEASRIFSKKFYVPPPATSINMAEISPFLAISQKKNKLFQQKQGKSRQKKHRKSTHTNQVLQSPKFSLPLAIHQQKQVKNSHQNASILLSRLPQMIDVNLSYSQEQQVLTNSIYINPNSYLTTHVGRVNNGLGPDHRNNSHNNQNNCKKHYQSNRLDKSTLQIGIQLMYIQKMQQKFKRLHNDDDALDFQQLFQRYKQTLKCLQTSQRINRLHQIRYNTFINQILQQKQQNPSFSIQQQLHNLSKFVIEQKRLLEQQKYQFENSFIEHIKTSQKNIQQQLKFMRIEYLNKR